MAKLKGFTSSWIQHYKELEALVYIIVFSHSNTKLKLNVIRIFQLEILNTYPTNTKWYDTVERK